MLASNKSEAILAKQFSIGRQFSSFFMSSVILSFFRELICNGVAFVRQIDSTAHEYYALQAARLPSWKPNYNTRNHLSDNPAIVTGKLSASEQVGVQFFRANLLNSSLLRRIAGCACSFFTFSTALILNRQWSPDGLIKIFDKSFFLLAAGEGRWQRGS